MRDDYPAGGAHPPPRDPNHRHAGRRASPAEPLAGDDLLLTARGGAAEAKAERRAIRLGLKRPV